MQDNGRTSAVKQFMQNKWVRLIIIIDVLVIVAVIGVIIWNSAKTATLNLNIAPIDATIQIDGLGEYHNGAVKVHPGTHEITITHDGLNPKTLSVDAQNGYIVTAATFLSNDDDFSFYELKDNYTSFQKLAEIASASNNITTDHDTSAEIFINDFNKNYAIFDILPIIDQTPSLCGASCGTAYQYNILKIADGRPLDSCVDTLCLYITDTLGDKEEYAKSVIQKLGYDLKLFQIIYEKVNHEN